MSHNSYTSCNTQSYVYSSVHVHESGFHLDLNLGGGSLMLRGGHVGVVKKQLHKWLGEETLDQALHVCIEGPNQLSNDSLEAIVTHWKEQKYQRISV